MPRSALVLAVGAGLYALALGALDVTFNATPLLIGAVVLAAAVLGDRPQLTGTGLVLVGWGAAVLGVREGQLPADRSAAAFLLGAGLGLVATRILRRLTNADLGDGAYAILSGGLAFYLAYDIAELGRWPVWAGAMLVWALFEAVQGGRRTRR